MLGVVSQGQTCVPGNGMQCSANLNLYLPPFNYYNWDVALNANFSLIDTDSANWVQLNALNIFTQNQTMPGLVITGAPSGTYAKADGTGYGTPSSGSTTCAANQISYYLSSGNVQACLTVGTGLGITSGTLSATGGATGINQLTGDGTAGPGTGSQALTLATVNSSSGTCGDATHVCQITTNGKGLTTTQTPVTITGASLTVVQKNCLSVACAGGSTYVSGTTYTNSSGVPVMEEVTMTGGGGCTGSDSSLVATIAGVTGPANWITNDCAGQASVTFLVPTGATFHVTAANVTGGGTVSITSWLELSL
jgi:hypothetical protein